MPSYAPDKSLEAGMTLLEILVALAIMAATVTALVGLFRASITTSLFSTRQTFVLSNARKAMRGDGPKPGVLWGVQQSTGVYTLSANSLNLILSDGTSATYNLSGDNLYRSGALLAKGVTDLQLSYYNIDYSGHIIVSTAPQYASLITAAMTLKGKLRGETTYYFYTAAWARNQ